MLPEMGSFHVLQEGPVNALALNKDNTQVAIGGRNVFKIYAIEEDKFREVCNLRASKHLNLSFSCNDVSWSLIDDHYLATAATNGHVCVWNLTKMGKAMQEQDYQEHKRTVNKVNFHLSEPFRLISGSQDGTMRYFDIRVKSAVTIFYSNTESVRDVQFSPHNPYSFAAVSENGSVQLWDVRRSDKCQQQYTAHSGPIFACDWHPEKNTWLATASRDKSIKVWNLSNRPTLEYTIHTIASIGHIKWRPQREHHIASCALVVDSSINIWDVRRPYIPFAAFSEHKDVTSGVAWRGDPYMFLSTGRDCALYQHVFNNANRPSIKANPQGISLNSKGEILFAYKINTITSTTSTTYTTKPMGITRKISNTQIVDHFHLANSLIKQFTFDPDSLKDERSFIGLANNYVLNGRSLSEMCDHNSAVAKEYGKPQISGVWQIIKSMYGEEYLQNSLNSSSTRDDVSHNNIPVNNVASNVINVEHNNDNDQRSRGGGGDSGTGVGAGAAVAGNNTTTVTATATTTGNTTGTGTNTGAGNGTGPGTGTSVDTSTAQFSNADDEMEYEDQVDHVALYSNGFPTYLNFRTGLPKGDFSFGENELDMELDGIVTDFRNGYRNFSHIISQQEWALPHEAFHIRHEIRDRSPPPEQFPNNNLPDINDEPQPFEEQPSGLLTVNFVAKNPMWNPSNIVLDALKYHAVLGDVQTVVCVLIVLGDQRKTLLNLDENIQEHWLLGYIEILTKFRLWNIASQIIKLAWIPAVSQLNQQSTRINTNCSKCSKPLQRIGWLCDRCHSSEYALCSVCHQVVKGLYAWCQGCSHGGHLIHMRKWISINKTCPTGCGHLCEYK